LREKARELGLQKKSFRLWSKKDLDILKRLYTIEELQVIAEKLGRSISAVRGKAHKLGLKNQNAVVPWSIQEETLLKKLYPDNTIPEIASQIGRSVAAITNRAQRLELKKCRAWSKKELNLLKKLYPRRTAQELAEQIGRPVQAVRLRLFRLGLNKRFRYEESHRVVSGVKQKRCSGCKRWKAGSEFYRLRTCRDGLAIWCKECANKAIRKSQKRRLAVRN